jgi:hypothetical protein
MGDGKSDAVRARFNTAREMMEAPIERSERSDEKTIVATGTPVVAVPPS